MVDKQLKRLYKKYQNLSDVNLIKSAINNEVKINEINYYKKIVNSYFKNKRDLLQIKYDINIELNIKEKFFIFFGKDYNSFNSITENRILKERLRRVNVQINKLDTEYNFAKYMLNELKGE